MFHKILNYDGRKTIDRKSKRVTNVSLHLSIIALAKRNYFLTSTVRARVPTGKLENCVLVRASSQSIYKNRLHKHFI